MLSAWNEFEQNAKDFLLDVHTVTRNFMGEQNWQWTENVIEVDALGEVVKNTTTAYQRFTEEMTQGTEVYSNNSNLEDRIALGACAALYCIPYALGRTLIYDPICNIMEYVTWRINGKSQCAIEPTGRERNGYILGAPLSLIFIIPLAIGEAIARIAGFTQYGGYIIAAAFKRAVSLFHRSYSPYSPQEIVEAEGVLTSAPTTVWDSLDRIGYVTFPGLIAGMTIITGAVCGVIARIVEAAGRLIGISQYACLMIAAGHMSAVNMVHRHYQPYSPEEIQKVKNVLISAPADGWDILDRIGCVIPSLNAGLQIIFGIVVGIVARIGEVIGRLLGFTEYGLNIIKAAFMCAANMLHRDHIFYTPKEIKDIQTLLTAKPQSNWHYLDGWAYVTLPGMIAFVEIIVGAACGLVARVCEATGRIIGISNRAVAASSVIFAKCENMFGAIDPPYILEDMQTLKAPVKSIWDFFDIIGITFSGIVSMAISIGVSPFALLGLTESNYHRFIYYKYYINNAIYARLGIKVDDTKERYHKTQLKNCEKTYLGGFFSRVNVINIIAQGIYVAARFIIAPVIYGTVRSIKHLFGMIPLVKTIYRAYNPIEYNLNDPIDRVRKRFADLTKSLSVEGHLPRGKKLYSDIIAEEVKHVDNRNIFSRGAFSLFSEARKILSLGHTLEEKIIAEFQDKFDELVRIKKRKPDIDISPFFIKENNLSLKNAGRFSYNNMIKQVKKSFSHPEDLKEIEKIAHLLFEDFKKEWEGNQLQIIYEENNTESSTSNSTQLLI